MQQGNPSPPNLVGANPALMAAIQRRQGGQSPLNQIGSGTPAGQSAAPAPAAIPGSPSATAGVSQGGNSPTNVGPNSAEAKIISAALGSRLKRLGDFQEAEMGIPSKNSQSQSSAGGV